MDKYQSYDYESDSSSSSEDFKWKENIDADGNVFYYEALPLRQSTICLPSNSNEEEKNESSGILGRLIRRRNSLKKTRKFEKTEERKPAEKVLLNKEVVTINIKKFKDVSLNLGRRGTLTEQILGFRVREENNDIVIISILEDSPFLYTPRIMIGDVLTRINNKSITPQNLDSVVYECQDETSLTILRLKNEEKLIKCNSLAISKENQIVCNNMGVLFAKFKSLSEDSSNDGVIYLFPKTSNIIFPIKGVFFTLYHLLSLITSTSPTSTSIKTKDEILHVIYSCEKDKLCLFALPDSRYSLDESVKVVIEMVQYYKYMSQSLARWFEPENFPRIDTYFNDFFKKIKDTKNGEKMREFEDILLSAPFLPIPRDVYVQIDDALNELESNDFLVGENQRLFSVVGSAFMFKGKIVCSHMSHEDLIEVTTTFRQSGLLKMSENGVKDLMYWREVYPSKYLRGLLSYSSSLYSVPVGQWFLLVVAQGNNFLAVLLESGGPTEKLTYKGPDEAYVDEAQSTLQHIISLGIPQIINKWIGKLEDENNSDKKSLSSVSHQNLSFSEFSSKSDLYDPDERSNSDTVPVMGRRAEREMANELNMRLRISSSDISDDSDLKDRLDRSSEISDLSKSTIIERPLKSQYLFHYVELNMTEGILVASPGNEGLKNYDNVINNFRKYSHKIKKMFMNTISFKKLKSKELQRFVWNKSLVAIKEFGINFMEDEKSNYWVIGRLFSTPILREVYVCYADVCPQNLVELAFSLSLSSP